MRLMDLSRLSRALAAERGRSAKTEAVAALLEGAASDEAALAVSWLCGELLQGKIGVGWAALQQALSDLRPAPDPSDLDGDGASRLGVRELDEAFTALAAVSGAGSNARRIEILRAIFARAGEDGRRFLVGLISGELRQGAQEGVILAAVARAFEVEEAALRRAVMLEGQLPSVAAKLAAARAVGADPREVLENLGLALMRPVQPMLAGTAEGLDAFDEANLADMLIEPKLDGARVQVHVEGGAVRCWSRALNEVTHAVPEIVEAVLALGVRDAIFDGEVIALRPDGRPHPFQTTMRRFGRRLEVEAARKGLPLTGFFFDLLRLDGESLIDRPLSERRARLLGVIEGAGPAITATSALVAPDREAASAFFAATLASGHEGLMLKRLDSAYEAGQRGKSWLKLKPDQTLDLVVVAVEVGSGRRSQWLSNLHLAARDEGPDGVRWVMLGKTFKGMTDALLEWQTRELSARELRREGHVVHVRPELVVEIAFQELEASPRYPGGVALRFARVRRYRPDKGPHEADTLATVRALFEAQGGVGERADAPGDAAVKAAKN